LPVDAKFFRSPAELREWLDEHHQSADELFVGAWRKSAGRPTLTWEEIVDEALCVGWIDGVRRSVGGDRWAIRLTPRRKGSTWSNRNIGRVKALRAEGRMRPAGEAAFEARREDRSGIYSFENRDEARLSPDQERRFKAERKAWEWFSAQSPSYRKTAIFWVASAKRPETRERRLATLIEDSAAGRDVGPIGRNRRPGGN
jgi:uncharacterized protein YdeI (YjbR/CyaY-like superfamily)